MDKFHTDQIEGWDKKSFEERCFILREYGKFLKKVRSFKTKS